MSGRLAVLIGAAVIVVLAAGSGIAYGVSSALSSHHHSKPAAVAPPSTSRTTSGNSSTTGTSTTTTTTSAPTPTPPTTAATSGVPGGSWSLPAGKTVQGIVTLGFPQSTLGGVSMAYQGLAAEATLDPGVLATVDDTVELNPPSNLAQQAQSSTSQTRQAFGLPATGPVSATIAAQIQGCWVQAASATEVSGGFEGEFVESDPTTGEQTAQFAVPFVVHWTGSDWRIDEPASANVHLPDSEIPPASGVSTDGWHACSGGS